MSDTAGNTNSSCAPNFIVRDDTPPTVVCPGPITNSTDLGVCERSLVLAVVAAMDECGIASIASNAPAAFPVGQTVVTWTVVDVNNNTNTCTQLVVIEDRETPVVTVCPAPQTNSANASCEAAVPDYTTGVGATDNCTPAASLVIRQVPGPGTMLGLGSHAIQLHVSDGAGNTNSSCATTFVVRDTTPPSITCLPLGTLSCLADVPAPDFSGSVVGDNCSMTPAVIHVGDVTNGICPMIITRTWRATDDSGNTNDGAQTITVHDTTPPVLAGCPTNQFVTTTNLAGETVAFASPTATDNCDAAPAVACVPPGGSLFAPGNTTVACTTIDTCGNTNACTFVVNVNRAPFARADGAGSQMGRAVSIIHLKLLANDSDPDGDPLVVSAVSSTNSTSSTSTNGGAVALTATHVTYTPRPGFFGEDRFTYTISDGRGGTATAVVVIFVSDGALPSLNRMSIVPKPGGGLLVRFAGIPGHTYTFERSTDMMNWSTAPGGTLAAPVHGILEYCDPNPPQPAAFYRTSSP